jgi:glycosyltransferase involved in cell wall biosynthesis
MQQDTLDAIWQARLHEHVFLHGRQDVRPFITSASAVAHTAAWEGLPRVGLEAAAIGRRFVAYDVKGARDIPGAVLVRDGDAKALADALLLADGEPEEQLVAALPMPEALSSTTAALRALAFVQTLVCGS